MSAGLLPGPKCLFLEGKGEAQRETKPGLDSEEEQHTYLELPGQVLLMALLHLLELGLQSLHLVLHLLHILQVPLGPPVQDLYGLRHVLHLSKRQQVQGRSCSGCLPGLFASSYTTVTFPTQPTHWEPEAAHALFTS